VTGTPTLTLNSGVTASYTAGDGTNALTFHYTVAAGESTTDRPQRYGARAGKRRLILTIPTDRNEHTKR
jgi:hypothetical protein